MMKWAWFHPFLIGGYSMFDSIFVDFDNVLCLHSHDIHCKDYILSPAEYISEAAFKESAPNFPLIKWLKEKQHDYRTQIYVLTPASSFMVDALRLWIDEKCKDISISGIISYGSDVEKRDIIAAYFKIKTTESRTFVIVDDPEERADISELSPKLVVRSPQWIMNTFM